jgi:hypothetical protein
MFPDSINSAIKLNKNNLAMEEICFCNTTRLKSCVKKVLEGDHEEAEPDVKQL